MSVSFKSESCKKLPESSNRFVPVVFQVMQEDQLLISSEEIAQYQPPITTIGELKQMFEKEKGVLAD